MKALKEKRISLRSLWRRGLVILSLFALVFASCGDSSSSDESSAGPRVIDIQVVKAPANDQFLGLPVDLEGTVLKVIYSSGNSDTVTYKDGNFSAYPPIFTGSYNAKGGFDGITTCEIGYKNRAVTASFEGNAWGIIRTDAKTNTVVDGALWGIDSGYYSMGLNLTGNGPKEAYADDNDFNFSGLTLEAEYYRVIEYPTATSPAILDRAKKAIKFQDVTYSIMPSYDMYTDGTGDSRGYVSVTVGEDIYGVVPGGFAGITTTHELDRVHIVTKVEPLGFPSADDLAFFYWEPNDRAYWLDKIGPDAKIRVSYSGGKPPKDIGIQEYSKKARIWWNERPENAVGNLNTGIGTVKNIYDLDIVPVRYPLTTKANEKNGIQIFYRGFSTDIIDVPVLTQLLTLKADANPDTTKDGKVEFDPAETPDNDAREDFDGSRGLSKLIVVTATYQAYNVASVQKTLVLRYKAWVDDDVAAGATNYEPYYTFNKDVTDASYEKQYNKWWQTYGKHKLPSFDGPVTVGHSVKEQDFTGQNGVGAPSIGVVSGYDSNFPDATAALGAYVFTRIPDFTQNLSRAKDRNPLTGFATKSGWEWMPNTNNLTWTGTFLGTGVKSKAIATSIPVTWLVND